MVAVVLADESIGNCARHRAQLQPPGFHTNFRFLDFTHAWCFHKLFRRSKKSRAQGPAE
jgi:hypothetical protein